MKFKSWGAAYIRVRLILEVLRYIQTIVKSHCVLARESVSISRE